MNKTLGERMKEYEGVSNAKLTRRMPVIIRIDGKAFHTFTKGLKRPFDNILIRAMSDTAKYLCENIQGCKLAYTQSDEISLLLTDYDKINTDAWFDNKIQKMVSISASMATLEFNRVFRNMVELADVYDNKYKETLYKKISMGAMFDSRVFNIPREDVRNYFIWRKNDCTRNSILSVGQSVFSHKELHGKKCDDILNMLKEVGMDWVSDYKVYERMGICVARKEKECIIKVGDSETTVIRKEWDCDSALLFDDIECFNQLIDIDKI